MGTGQTPTKTTPKLFARQATGLVRAVPQRASLIFNFIPSHPAFVLSAGIFFAFSLFPGGNFILALVLDIPLILAFAYSYGLLASELRQARSTRTANVMALAGTAAVIAIAIFGVIFLHTFGTAFVTAANSATGLPSSIAASPTYFFLLSASVGSVLVAVILVFTYAVYWPLNTYCNFMQQSRIIFAWAFDGLLPESTTRLSRRHSPFVALIATVAISIATLFWSLHSSTFLTVIVYATILALIAMMLVGLSAAIVPWRRPEFYRGGATQARLLGVPVVTIAGVASILAGSFVWWLYLHYPQFGVSNKANMFEWVFGVVAAALIFYYLVRWILRARRGVKLELVYAEIPPE